MEPIEEAAELGEEVASKPSQESSKLRSIRVGVPEPSPSKIKDGKIQVAVSPGTKGDCLKEAELYLTPTTLCYKIEDVGVSCIKEACDA